MSDPVHWERIYHERTPQTLGWYQATPALSLALIEAAGLARTAPIIDVGGGASRLVDHLLDAGYADLTVLDLSRAALAVARARLGARADAVHWQAVDVTDFEPARRYALWHDRAVLHFLIEEPARARYRAVLERALAPDGHVVIGTFALDGPPRCSGLPVQRYDAAGLQALLGPGFDLLETRAETHLTPGGTEQRFAWFRLRRRPV